MEKVNYSEKCLFCVNQAYLTVQKSENILYADHFILEQVIAAPNVPTDVDSYECGSNEVKIVRPLYHVATGEFKGLAETIGHKCRLPSFKDGSPA